MSYEEFNRLPAKYKKYPVGKPFKLPDKRYGTVDALISHCKPPAYVREFWIVETCHYSFSGLHRCTINRWGCGIHHQGPGPNIFGIED